MRQRVFRSLAVVLLVATVVVMLWPLFDSSLRYLSYRWMTASAAHDLSIGREPGRFVLSYESKPGGFPFAPYANWQAQERHGFAVIQLKEVFSNPYPTQDVTQSVELAAFRYYQLAISSNEVFGGVSPPIFLRVYALNIPSWFFIVLPLLVSIFLWRRSRHRLPNTCDVCAYNLTGNTSGVCPECGTAVSAIPGTGSK